MGRSSPSRRLLVLALLTLAATAACSPAAPVTSAASLPPSAAPEVVLDAYLRALVAGDCETGRKLATATFVKGNGELCGDTQVSPYRIQPEPARPSADETVFATTDGGTDRVGRHRRLIGVRDEHHRRSSRMRPASGSPFKSPSRRRILGSSSSCSWARYSSWPTPHTWPFGAAGPSS